MSKATRPIVIASNRGPVTHRLVTEGDTTRLISERGSGGLVSGLKPLLDAGDVLWVSAAMSDGDRAAAEAQEPEDPVQLITMSDDELTAYYDTISNETLWFIHHGLYDLVRAPDFDTQWWAAWDVYESINTRFAELIAGTAPEGAVVLVQDYHLSLVAPTLRRLRDDLSMVHFSHTPFAGPDDMRVLPDRARNTLLGAMAAFDACGFHTDGWATNFTRCLEHFTITTTDAVVPTAHRPTVFAATLSSDITEIGATAASEGCNDELADIDREIGDRRLVVRVDRMELSKNIVRGFHAFDLLFRMRPDLRGNVEFLARCYPSRESVEAYRRYRDEVFAAAESVNRRWATDDWTPVRLEADDNYERSVAALRRYDVLLVNPIRDGLNLVAKEGPAVNEHHGQLVLSDQAGAWSELAGAAFGINPFDLVATAQALADALDLDEAARIARADDLRRLATVRTPIDWLEDQIAVLDR